MPAKIGDLVDVRPLQIVDGPYNAPDLAVGGYYFTDITADLMTKWLGSLSEVCAGQGRARALAGFRGSGKSHFLAAVAGILSSPDVRSKIGDIHVKTEVDSLSRTKWPIAIVKRGSSTDLVSELRDAVAQMLGVSEGSLPENIPAILLRAFEACQEPFALFIDTDPERDSLVARQDGPQLVEIGEAAKAIGLFAAVALDDDIAGAEGMNAAIVTNYTIDYLEQEHLFKIIDSNLFVKSRGSAAEIQNIYKQLQSKAPRFRWSEQRFCQLYPLHPVVAEAAPFLRLYLRNFTLLNFAEAAGREVLTDPADRVIGPDKIFDAIEPFARTVKDLVPMFEAYDRLRQRSNEEIEKRILKTLFILSVEGRFVSPEDISSALVLDAPDAANATRLLTEWSNSGNRDVQVDILATGLHAFQLSKGRSAVLGLEGIEAVEEADIWRILIQHAGEKYSDISAFEEVPEATPCAIEWRGGIRRGIVDWSLNSHKAGKGEHTPDWKVVVCSDPSQFEAGVDNFYWRVSPLTEEERRNIALLHLIRTDDAVREKLADSLAIESHRLALALDSAWLRTFVKDASFVTGSAEVSLPPSLLEAGNLAQVMSVGLGPLFDAKYPEHPVFEEVLHQGQAAMLISGFLSADGGTPAGTASDLAGLFALPLGIASKSEDVVELLSRDALKEAKVVQTALPQSVLDGKASISLVDIAKRFRASKMGLSVDAQHVVLGALVARRLIDLVTKQNNRITYRSLDLQIIWDDIIGVAPCLSDEYSAAKLDQWSKLLIGSKLPITNIQAAASQLEEMLVDWGAESFLETFHSLPDDALGANLWRRIAKVEKKFQNAKRVISEVREKGDVQGAMASLIALFADEPENYQVFRREITDLDKTVEGAKGRERIVNSIHFLEATSDEETETRRASLVAQLLSPRTSAGGIESLWEGLRRSYSTLYARKHEAARKATQIRDWDGAVEHYLDCAADQNEGVRERMRIRRDLRTYICDANVAEIRPDGTFCGCQASLRTLETIVAVHTEA
ncbi:MAG: hypothetical protein JO053_14880 [Acidobacteria bacterium]|nr:hypothetical protein [Acidobacteriota bacterium]